MIINLHWFTLEVRWCARDVKKASCSKGHKPMSHAQAVDKAMEARWEELLIAWNVPPELFEEPRRRLGDMLRSVLAGAALAIMDGKPNPLNLVESAPSHDQPWGPLAVRIAAPRSREVSDPFHGARSILTGQRAIGQTGAAIDFDMSWNRIFHASFKRMSFAQFAYVAECLARDAETLVLASIAREAAPGAPGPRL